MADPEPPKPVLSRPLPIRNALAWAASFAVAVLLVSGAAAYLSALYGIREAADARDRVIAQSDRQAARTEALYVEYRRQQCVVLRNLPEPQKPDVVELRRQLRCDEVPDDFAPPSQPPGGR